MSVPVIVAAAQFDGGSINLPFQETTALVPQAAFTLASDATVTITAFSDNLEPNDVEIILTLDGSTVLFDGGAGLRLTFTRRLVAGSHTVDYTAFAFGSNVSATNRGVVVTDLTSGV